MPNNQKKGLFDFASEHPFITLWAISDLFTMVTNVVGYICGRGERKRYVVQRAANVAKEVSDISVKKLEAPDVSAEPTVEAEA